MTDRAKDLNTSLFTSIKERIDTLMAANNEVENGGGKEDKHTKYTLFQPEGLMPFGLKDSNGKICCSLIDFIDMVDWTGRKVRDDKKGFIDNRLPNLVTQLEISEERWLYLTQQFERKFAGFAGQSEMLYYLANQQGQQYFQGVG